MTVQRTRIQVSPRLRAWLSAASCMTGERLVDICRDAIIRHAGRGTGTPRFFRNGRRFTRGAPIHAPRTGGRYAHDRMITIRIADCPVVSSCVARGAIVEYLRNIRCYDLGATDISPLATKMKEILS